MRTFFEEWQVFFKSAAVAADLAPSDKELLGNMLSAMKKNGIIRLSEKKKWILVEL